MLKTYHTSYGEEKDGKCAKKSKEGFGHWTRCGTELMRVVALNGFKVMSIVLSFEYFHSLTFFLNSTEYKQIVHFLQPLIGAPIFFYIMQGVFVMLAPRYLLSKDWGTVIFHPLKAISGYYLIRSLALLLRF